MFNLKDLYKGNLPWLVPNTVVFGLAGSRSYGLETPESDYDFKGLVIPPKEYFLGFKQKFEQAEVKKTSNDVEFTIYDIRKFFYLCANANPNIIELLWLDPKDYLILTPIGEKIVAARDLFLSKKAKFTFAGYALSQLTKMRSHRSWLLQPPKKKPTRADFGLPANKALITGDQKGAMDELLNKKVITEEELSPNFLQSLAQEKAYHQARMHWEQYQEWKRSRNPKRAELEDKFGFDTKNASHLVRLMRMCKEILIDHKVVVKRPDREEILAVKNGAWKYEQLIEWAEQQEKEMNELYEKSTLRREPDLVDLDKLCIELIEDFLKL